MTQAINSDKLVCNDFLAAGDFYFYSYCFTKFFKKNEYFENGNSNDIIAMIGIIMFVQLLKIR